MKKNIKEEVLLGDFFIKYIRDSIKRDNSFTLKFIKDKKIQYVLILEDEKSLDTFVEDHIRVIEIFNSNYRLPKYSLLFKDINYWFKNYLKYFLHSCISYDQSCKMHSFDFISVIELTEYVHNSGFLMRNVINIGKISSYDKRIESSINFNMAWDFSDNNNPIDPANFLIKCLKLVYKKRRLIFKKINLSYPNGLPDDIENVLIYEIYTDLFKHGDKKTPEERAKYNTDKLYFRFTYKSLMNTDHPDFIIFKRFLKKVNQCCLKLNSALFENSTSFDYFNYLLREIKKNNLDDELKKIQCGFNFTNNEYKIINKET